MNATKTGGSASVGSTICWTVTSVQGELKASTSGPGTVTTSVQGGKPGTWTVCVTLTGPGMVDVYLSGGAGVGQSLALGVRAH